MEWINRITDLQIQYLAWISSILGLATMPLSILQKIHTWPVNIALSLLNMLIYYRLNLCDRVFLSVVTFFMNFYGWYSWKSKNKSGKKLRVTHASPLLLLILLIVALLASLIFYKALQYIHSNQPKQSAIYCALNFMATWLMAKKKLESHLVWMATNVLSFFIFSKTGVPILSLKHAVYFSISIYTYYRWRNSMLKYTPHL